MRRIVSGLAALALSVTLAGCGGDGDPEASPSTSGSPSASESGSTEPTEEPSETVTPIEGVTRSVNAVSATVPKEWKKTQYIGDIAFYDNWTKDGLQQITLAGLPWYSKPSLGQTVKDAVRRAEWGKKYERLDDLVGPGSVPMFHIRGASTPGTSGTVDIVGGVNSTHTFEVRMESPFGEAEHEAFVDSVIPTIAFPDDR